MSTMHHNFNITGGAEPHQASSISQNPLPRVILRANSHFLLDGEWYFELDNEDRGLREAWFLGHRYKHTAHWPGSVEAHMAAARGLQQSQSPAWEDKVIAWYEREFPRPERNTSTPSMFQITFGASGYATRVWLNGRPLLTIDGEEVHYGEYTSFSYELDERDLLPINYLTVRIESSKDAETPRGKQESHVYKRGGIWYQTYTGAIRSVWLETVERNRLRSRIGVISVIEDSIVRFGVTTRVHDPGMYTIRLKIYEREGQEQEPITTADFPLYLEEGQKHQYVVVNMPDAELWSPDNPHLYRLVAQLIDSNGYTAEIQGHFGLRKFEARGRHLYLNNEEIYIDGILYQPGTATYEEMRRHMYAMKALGCNLVRVHIAGVDPRIYNLADEIGLLLWVEVPSPHSSTPRSRENHRAQLLRMLALIETNPSVVIWSLYNEDWGAQDIATNPQTRQYIMDAYHFMKIKHPQYLVVDNDGWRHISLEGKLKTDLLTVHLYTPDLERWQEILDQLVAGQLEDVAAFPLVVGDPYFYRGQTPIIVSEWGGFGFSDYGGPQDAAERAERIHLFKQELRKRDIAGDIYTQATNIEDERNGIIDPHTGELSVPAGLLSSREFANAATPQTDKRKVEG